MRIALRIRKPTSHAEARSLAYGLARRGVIVLGWLLLGLWAAAAHAVVSYSAQPTTFNWISAATQAPVPWSNGAACSPGTADGSYPDDDITAPISLGFTFTFRGTGYTQVQVMANGRLQFNNGYCYYGTPYPTLPNPNLVNTLIPFGIDFDPGNPGSSGTTACDPNANPACAVLYGRGGTAPNRYFVVTWENVPEWNAPGSYYNVQAILYENGTFAFQYGANSNNPQNGLPTVGWEIDSSSNYYSYPYAAPGSLQNTAILFTSNLLDHFAITAPAYGSTCPTSAVQVGITAEDALNNALGTYTGLVTITVSSGSGNATLAANRANGTLTFLGYDPNTGYPQWSYQFVATDAGSIILNMSDNSAETVNLTVSDFGTGISNTSGNTTFRRGSLVVANAPGEIPVPVAGRPQKMTVTLYNGCNVATGFNSAKQKMTVWLTLDPSQPVGAALPGVTGNDGNPKIVSPLPTSRPGWNIRLAFIRGVADFTLNASDVGKYLLNWCQGNGSTCGSVPITVVPFGLAVVVPGNRFGQDSTCPAFAKAGANFGATVSAYLWNAAQDANNDGVPDPGTNITGNPVLTHFSWPVTLAAASPFVPSGGTLGTLANGSVSVVNGSGTVNNLQYSEVGSLTIAATAANYLNTPGLNATGSSALDSSPDCNGNVNGYVGRFTPAWFALQPGASLTNRQAAACSPASSFSYMGEGMGLSFTLSAQNTASQTTQNYTGAFAKLNPALASSFAFGAKSGATNLTGRVSASSVSGSWSNGQAAVQATVAIGRNNTGPNPQDNPDGPYAGVNFGIAPVDSDGVAMNVLDLSVAGGSNDHKNLGVSTEVRFGRLACSNALGAVQLPLPLPMVAQYWNGSAFVTNAADSCTPVNVANVTYGNYRFNLNPGEVGPPGITQIANGIGRLLLPQPSGGDGIYNGSMSVTIDVAGAGMGYLLGNWSLANPDNNPATAYDVNPSCSASFGLYGSQPNQFTFMRENY